MQFHSICCENNITVKNETVSEEKIAGPLNTSKT